MRKPASLRERALGLLARREHSRHELWRKLSPHAATPDELEALLDDLSSRHWLSDERFSERYVASKSRQLGSRRLVQELRQRGVSDELARNTVRAAALDEAAALRGVWEKKFGTPPADEAERARHIRFLLGRGFDMNLILSWLRTCQD